MKKKIGFIFLDEIHHIHHFISVFVELYKKNDYEIDIITSEIQQVYLKELLILYGIPLNVIRPLPTFNYRKILNKIRNRKIPSHVFIFKKNKKIFLKYDILVYNVPQHKYLLNQRKKGKPKFVFLDHGAGDQDYIYNERLLNFDLVTVAGKKVEEICKSNADFSKTNIQICGYQKFDTVAFENINNTKNTKLFNNNNPVIIYNPHFKKIFSSYYILGNDVLEFFYNNKNYNLIFAPHINLFNKKRYLKKEMFNKKYLNQNNIIIDFGSVKSVNMHYTLAADIYLGDVSSQIYEFLMKSRPCIFINATNVDWENNNYYRNWKLGKVITNFNNFDEVLKSANIWQDQFKEKQVKLMKYTFDILKEKTASERITTEIIKLLN